MWETIKDIYLSVHKTSTERIKSPFYGVFILTWLAWNWKPVAILLFSEMTMENRINFINFMYPMTLWQPILIAASLAIALPIINEKFTAFQSKPISRTSVIMAVRKKRALVADISVERYRAKRDVTYDRFKAGAEQEIQEMHESIVQSQARMGEITAERDKLQGELYELKKSHQKIRETSSRFSDEVISLDKISKEQNIKISELENAVEKKEDDIKNLKQVIIDISNDFEKFKSQKYVDPNAVRSPMFRN